MMVVFTIGICTTESWDSFPKWFWKPSSAVTPEAFFLVKEAGSIPAVRNSELS